MRRLALLISVFACFTMKAYSFTIINQDTVTENVVFKARANPIIAEIKLEKTEFEISDDTNFTIGRLEITSPDANLMKGFKWSETSNQDVDNYEVTVYKTEGKAIASAIKLKLHSEVYGTPVYVDAHSDAKWMTVGYKTGNNVFIPNTDERMELKIIATNKVNSPGIYPISIDVATFSN